MRPCLVSTWGPTPKKYFLAFLETAKKHGLEPHNADSEDWPGADWTTIPWYRKSEAQYRFVRDTQGQFDLYMFTDSFDVVFASGWDEIISKFQKLNSPIVFASECYPWPKTEQGPLYPETQHRCKYLNGGCWIAEPVAALKMLEDVAAIAAKREQCDQGIMVDMFLSKRHPIELDRTCSIAFCCNMDSLSYLKPDGNRMVTTDTSEQPCLFHGNGASDLRGICAVIAP